MEWFEKRPEQKLLNLIFRRSPFSGFNMWVWERTNVDDPRWWERPILKVTGWLNDFDDRWVQRKFLVRHHGH